MPVRVADLVAGGEGSLVANIGGNIETVGYVRSFSASIEKIKEEIRLIGDRWTQNKVNGVTGSGTMTVYLTYSPFIKMVIDYAKTGKETYFTFIQENRDPSSSIGGQVTALYNVSFDSAVVASLDTDSATIEQEFPFTFSGIDQPEVFTPPAA